MEYHDEFDFRLLSFIIDQLKLLCVLEQARRYLVSIIRISFLWQLTSSSLYKKLHEFFILPSVRRLQSRFFSAAVSSGLIDVKYLSQKTRNLPLHDKIVTFIVDEEYVAQRIEYPDGAFVGFAADGSSAKTVLSFMVQSVCSNYKDVVCLFPVSKWIPVFCKHGFIKCL